ncbi:MAG TPA: hypothetical protein VEC37_12720 [Bacillota bacterium]|nr:hypothetical protein [Bacillota bacterium]
MKKNSLVILGVLMLVLIVAMAIAGCGSSSTSSTPKPSVPPVTAEPTPTATEPSPDTTPVTSPEPSPSNNPVVTDITIPFSENFSAADTSTFFNSTYKSFVSSIDSATYPTYKLISTAAIDSGTLVLAGGSRLLIGYAGTNVVNTASTDTATLGSLDLSKSYRIRFNIVAKSYTDVAKRLQVYVNNSTTTDANSVHGTTSRILNIPVSDARLVVGEPYTIATSTVVGTSKSFLQFRTEGSCSITIDNLTIEYQ